MKRTWLYSFFFFVVRFVQCEKDQNIPSNSYSNSLQPAEESAGASHFFADSINEPAQNDWFNYRILAGEHYNELSSLEFFPHDSMAVLVTFDSTAIYQTVKSKNQMDWNKLIGISDCQSHHHQNSARLVWRYSAEGLIDIGEYFYRNSVRSYNYLRSIEIDDTIFASVSARYGQYRLQVGKLVSTSVRNCNSAQSRYSLYPYFGGDEPAPHSINVFINPLYP